jgi:hypothetical protein
MRIEYPGEIYHVLSRGDQREAIFRTQPDRISTREPGRVYQIGFTTALLGSVDTWL